MDAQELQELKEWAGEQTSFKIMVQAPELRALITLAEAALVLGESKPTERAVSPAESVQSLHDDHQFQIVLDDYVNASADHREEKTSWDEANKAYKAVLAHIDASRAAAHAEGRRSAMEELHPQWLKEKERADRLDSALNEWLDKTQWVQDAVQSNKFSVMYLGHHRVDVIRQEFDKLAQPLQQEGGKEALLQAVDAVLRDALDAVTVHPCDMHNYNVRAQCLDGPMAILYEARHAQPSDNMQHPADGRLFTADQVAMACADADIPDSQCESLLIALHYTPAPDNLQQASTAQVEPATKSLQDMIKPPCEITPEDFGIPSEYSDRAISYHAYMCAHIELPSQATPEGAELPPLPWVKDGTHDIADWIDARSEQEIAEEFESYARAALAATAAAEPVYQWRVWAADAWMDCCEKEFQFRSEQGHETRTLYRAAPPQQVDTGGLPG